MNIQTPIMTPEPVRHLRENPSHSFCWGILCTAKSFHKRRINVGLILQQWSSSLNKEVYSFIAKLLQSGIT